MKSEKVLAGSDPSWQELADLHRKAVYDVLCRNLPYLDSLLESLSADDYSMTFVTVLFVKMNQVYTESIKNRFEQTLSQVESIIPFLNSSHISFIPDIYISLFRKVYDYYLHISKPARGIMILSNAISLLIKDEQHTITSLHPCLFCLCLKARIHDPAIPFLHLGVFKIFQETTNENDAYMDPKWVLLYFYYGGLLYAVLGYYRKAFLMMQKVCCMPAVLPSHIMLQAYKKYVLFSLVLSGKASVLPSYRSAVLTRFVIPLCPDYLALEKICESEEENFDKSGAVLEYLEAHYVVFETDKNVGLVKLVARSIRENAVKNLSRCFTSISLSDVVRRCFLNNINHAEWYLYSMSRNGSIKVRIDKKRSLAYFDEIRVDMEDNLLDQRASKIYKLDALLKQFDDEIRTSPEFVSRILRPPARGTASVPSDESLGHPGSVFMPNLNVGDIESAAGRPMDMVD
ncbi:unnamed protein product [Thelazia callipaeda]|uniref:COP9 signalosome complex subunit 3 n=1 Tax=Thelazia callipaeda TaxID=103827 RepID=A0A0N5CLV7_THECL|nr:unnamed protein product [Thelazia callipaeda]